jgi:hypothetical protein
METNSVPQGDQELSRLPKPEMPGHELMTEYVSPREEEKAEQATSPENEDHCASKMSTTRVVVLLGIIWVSHCLYAPSSSKLRILDDVGFPTTR